MNSVQTLSDLMVKGYRVLLVGPPGVAKTGRILAAAGQAGYRPVVFRASLAERIDVGGCLIPDAASGVTKLLPLELMHSLRSTKDKVLLFLDDLGQAPMDVQAALMRLFDAGDLGPNVLVWAATNRPADRAGVAALCEPLRSRHHLAFSVATHGVEETVEGAVLLQPWFAVDSVGAVGPCEVADWCDWAASNGAAPEIVAWHLSSGGRTLYTAKPHNDPAMRFADYRSWETVIRLWNDGLRSLKLLGAAVGKPVASEFLSYVELLSQLDSPANIVANPTRAMVPTDGGAMFFITMSLVKYAEDRNLSPLLQYIRRLPQPNQALWSRQVLEKLGTALTRNPDWKSWFRDNAELFQVN